MSKHETPESIEVIARGVFIRASRVLLCRNVRRGYYYLPGGHVEFGESAAEALEREWAEECGLHVKAGALCLVTEGSFSAKGIKHHELNLVFHVEHPGELPRSIRSHEKSIAFEWIDLAAIVDTDVRPAAVKAWLVSSGHSRAEFVSEMA